MWKIEKSVCTFITGSSFDVLAASIIEIENVYVEIYNISPKLNFIRRDEGTAYRFWDRYYHDI